MNTVGRRAWRVLGVVSLLIVCACRSCWLPSRGIERSVTTSELAGVWVLTPESLALLERDGYAGTDGERHFITLLESGTSAVATAWEGADAPERLEFRAEWTLHDDEDSTAAVRIVGEDRSLQFSIDEDDDGLVLFQFLVDPDEWEFIEFRRDD